MQNNQPAGIPFYKSKVFLYSVIFILFSVIVSFATPIKFLLKFTHDDSYFYIKIADNIAKGLGSTFDGINITNGYHPLWMIVLSVVYFIPRFFINADSDFILRTTALLHLLIAGATSLLIYRIYRILYKDNFLYKYILVVIICFIFAYTRDWGLETNLACLILASIIYIKTCEIFYNENRLGLKIFLIILLLLVRIDYQYLIIPLLMVGDYFTGEKKTRIRNFIIIGCSIAGVTAAYYLYNYLVYGHMLTISSILVSTYPENVFADSIKILMNPQYYPNHDVKLIFLFLAVGVYPLIRKKNLWGDKAQERYNLFLWFICVGFILLIILYLLYVGGLREWYMTAPAFMAALLFMRYLDKYNKLIKKLVIAFVILGAFYFYITRIGNSVYATAYDYGKILKNTLPEDSRTLMGNISGAVGFFSERQIINGDGLVNSFEYYDYLREGRIPEYIKKYNVGYYCTFTSYLDSTGHYNDVMHAPKRIQPTLFKFKKEDLMFTHPRVTIHVTGNTYGDWYLFRMREQE